MAENLTTTEITNFINEIQNTCNDISAKLEAIYNSCYYALATSTLANNSPEMHDLYESMGTTVDSYKTSMNKLITTMATDVAKRSDAILKANTKNAENVNEVARGLDELNANAEAIANKYAS